jgi:hypothetical protein
MAPEAQPTNGLLTNREKAIGFGGIGSLSCIFRIKNKKGGRETTARFTQLSGYNYGVIALNEFVMANW